jgi:hypothetical protein
MPFWAEGGELVKFIKMASFYDIDLVRPLERTLLEINSCGVGRNSAGWRITPRKNENGTVRYVRNVCAWKGGRGGRSVIQAIVFDNESLKVVAVEISGEVARN